eukprot:GCRY01002231.1.p1 GENE.GCRY01002231.1~~GCRY01002231.1.p1  ORF type:complete len:749 (-),score=190.12 GCRY01002231.1:495-2741(-)
MLSDNNAFLFTDYDDRKNEFSYSNITFNAAPSAVGQRPANNFMNLGSSDFDYVEQSPNQPVFKTESPHIPSSGSPSIFFPEDTVPARSPPPGQFVVLNPQNQFLPQHSNPSYLPLANTQDLSDKSNLFTPQRLKLALSVKHCHQSEDGVYLWNTDVKQELFIVIMDEKNCVTGVEKDLTVELTCLFENTEQDITSMAVVFGRNETQNKTLYSGKGLSWMLNFKYGYMTIYNKNKELSTINKARESFCTLKVQVLDDDSIQPAYIRVRPRRLREDLKKRQRVELSEIDAQGLVFTSGDTVDVVKPSMPYSAHQGPNFVCTGSVTGEPQPLRGGSISSVSGISEAEHYNKVNKRLEELDDKVNYILRVLSDVTSTVMAGQCADFCEYFEKANAEEEFSPGDVVAMTDGKITSPSTESLMFCVVTTNPLVVGNVPTSPEQMDRMVRIALVGQVPVKTLGPARAGQILVASLEEDEAGYARAVGSGELSPGQSRDVVGIVLEDAGLGAGEDDVVYPNAVLVRSFRFDEKDQATQLSSSTALPRLAAEYTREGSVESTSSPTPHPVPLPCHSDEEEDEENQSVCSHSSSSSQNIRSEDMRKMSLQDGPAGSPGQMDIEQKQRSEGPLSPALPPAATARRRPLPSPSSSTHNHTHRHAHHDQRAQPTPQQQAVLAGILGLVSLFRKEAAGAVHYSHFQYRRKTPKVRHLKSKTPKIMKSAGKKGKKAVSSVCHNVKGHVPKEVKHLGGKFKHLF